MAFRYHPSSLWHACYVLDVYHVIYRYLFFFFFFLHIFTNSFLLLILETSSPLYGLEGYTVFFTLRKEGMQTIPLRTTHTGQRITGYYSHSSHTSKPSVVCIVMNRTLLLRLSSSLLLRLSSSLLFPSFIFLSSYSSLYSFVNMLNREFSYNQTMSCTSFPKFVAGFLSEPVTRDTFDKFHLLADILIFGPNGKAVWFYST